MVGDPKRTRKKRSKRHARSIMQGEGDWNRCYLCMMLDGDYTVQRNLEKHHVFFGAGQRDKSEADGLTVRLCRAHHQGGPDAVHRNNAIRRRLCAIGQGLYEEQFGHGAYMERYGRDYLQGEEDDDQ